MLNSAAFGGAEARAALQSSMFDPELNYIGVDWCVSCSGTWKDTEEGRARALDLRQRMDEWGKDHPEEYAKIKANSSSK